MSVSTWLTELSFSPVEIEGLEKCCGVEPECSGMDKQKAYLNACCRNKQCPNSGGVAAHSVDLIKKWNGIERFEIPVSRNVLIISEINGEFLFHWHYVLSNGKNGTRKIGSVKTMQKKYELISEMYGRYPELKMTDLTPHNTAQ